MAESTESFEKRKREHLTLALRDENEAQGRSQLENIELTHEALPELDFDEVSLKSKVLGLEVEKPLLISSMTAGHVGSVDLNGRLASAAEQRGWLMGVGSQRRELDDEKAIQEWKAVRQRAPKVKLFGNLGLAQLIHTPTDKVKALVDSLEAMGMIIHLNALQECFQPEGTPQFKGGFKALERLAIELPVPVIVKETGCGFSETTLARLKETGVRAVDVSGLGGTHWGRIEGMRATNNAPVLAQAAETFKNWGISTVESLQNAANVTSASYEVWASGGVRSGLDAAKLFAMGAKCVGFAKPILQAALVGEEQLLNVLETIEHELKVALFCTGSKNLDFLRAKKVWKWQHR